LERGGGCGSQFGTRSAGGARESCAAPIGIPLYAFIRRQAHDPHDAQDLTQEFFAWLLESKHLRVADPERGKFRSFLLVRLKHFLSDERKKANAQKRGGGQPVLSLDAALAEESVPLGADDRNDTGVDLRPPLGVDGPGPNRRAFARGIRRGGPNGAVRGLKNFQPGEEAGRSYAEVAARLGLSQSA
jgi:RNA polymerase sigma-70 factor (ECF subfamily)